MNYRVTCLTPTLVGDGQKLAPIDYMVWKDHINVLDQQRIFRLLSKGPRLEGYLQQLKKADKLDFRSWGGFAQNFAGRRVAFVDPAHAIPVWEREPSFNLHVPTFAASASGPYLPATSIKGALRTGAVFERWSDGTLRDMAARLGLNDSESARVPRNASLKAEEGALGAGGKNRMRALRAGDTAPVGYDAMRIYLLRTSTLLEPPRNPKARAAAVAPAGSYQLGWKSIRGSVEARRVEEATPTFAEMAAPGTRFEGAWHETSESDRVKLFRAANKYAVAQLAQHSLYAEWTGLTSVADSLHTLDAQVADLAQRSDACLLSIGWGAGMLSKLSVNDTGSADFRNIVRRVGVYGKAVRTGMPFPKTRRVVFESGQASRLPGWILLEVLSS